MNSVNRLFPEYKSNRTINPIHPLFSPYRLSNEMSAILLLFKAGKKLAELK